MKYQVNLRSVKITGVIVEAESPMEARRVATARKSGVEVTTIAEVETSKVFVVRQCYGCDELYAKRSSLLPTDDESDLCELCATKPKYEED